MSLDLFIFLDRISRCNQGPEGVQCGDHRISSLLFADDAVPLIVLIQAIQHVWGNLHATAFLLRLLSLSDVEEDRMNMFES